MHRKNERNMDRGRDCLKEYSLKPDPDWQYRFFHLLLELVRFWGRGKSESGKPLPKKYTELYKALQAQKVFFPLQDDFLAVPPQLISNSGLHDAPPAGLFQNEPEAHPAVQQPQPAIQRTPAEPPAPAAANPPDHKRATDFVASSLQNIRSIRENIVNTAMQDPADDSSRPSPDLPMYVEIVKSSGEDLFGSPEYKAVARQTDDLLCKAVLAETDKETQVCSRVCQAYLQFASNLKPLELKAQLRSVYRDLLGLDLPPDEQAPAAPPQLESPPAPQLESPPAPQLESPPAPQLESPQPPPEDSQVRPKPPSSHSSHRSGVHRSQDPLQPTPGPQLYSKDSFGPPMAPFIAPPDPDLEGEKLARSDFIDDLLPEGVLDLDRDDSRLHHSRGFSDPGDPAPPAKSFPVHFALEDSDGDFGPPANPPPAHHYDSPHRSGLSNSAKQPPTHNHLLASSQSGSRLKPLPETLRFDQSLEASDRHINHSRPLPFTREPEHSLHQPAFRPDFQQSHHNDDSHSFDRGSPAFGHHKNLSDLNKHNHEPPLKRMTQHVDSEVLDDRPQPKRNDSSHQLSKRTESAWDKKKDSQSDLLVGVEYAKANPRPDSSGLAAPPRIQTVLDRVGGPVTTIKLELMNKLVDKVNAVEGLLKQAQVENRLLQQNLGLLEKAFLDAEQTKESLVDKASLLNEKDERLNSEISNLKTKKHFLQVKMQLKQKLLTELKKKTTATSDEDELRRIELTESVGSMEKLKMLKTAEMLRCKRQLDLLEKDYELYHKKKLEDETLQRQRPEESFHQSRLGYSQLIESHHRDLSQQREAQASSRLAARKSLTRGAGADFLADFNRELEELISNSSGHSQSTIKY